MIVVDGKIKEMVRNIIEEEKDFILIVHDNQGIRTFLVVNDRLQFVTIGRPMPSSMFINDDKNKILDTISDGKCFYHIFADGYSFNKLLKVAKDYDKQQSAGTSEFYLKYKKVFQDNIK